MAKQKIEITTAQLAEKKLNRIILVLFIFSLLFGLKDFISMGLSYINVLPNWWIIGCLTIFACSCIWSLDMAEKRMKQMRLNIKAEEAELQQMRMQFQLIYSDILGIKDPDKFEEYCADILRALGYLNVELTSRTTEAGKQISCTNGMGLNLLIAVKYDSPGSKVSKENIQTLHSTMINDGVRKGMFITTSDFSTEALDFAQECNIQCMNGVELAAMKQQALTLNNTMKLAVLQSESIG
ncbi:MAG TPA: hypothetical protein DCY20_04170 [Firmicutes bacterium]|nr:hypothetical protein [Bacillota bacterium]